MDFAIFEEIAASLECVFVSDCFGKNVEKKVDYMKYIWEQMNE